MSKHRLLFPVLVTLLVASGCAQEETCPGELNVSFSSNLQRVLDESSAPGEQVTIHVVSNLGGGVEVVLSVASAGHTLATYTGTSDALGDVVFSGVTLPAGEISLGVAAATTCGTATDELVVSVVDSANCALEFDQAPIKRHLYGPGVLNASIDLDAQKGDFQGTIAVSSVPGAQVDLLAVFPDGTETTLGTAVAADGVERFAVTLGQGLVYVRAVCSSPQGFGAASATHVVYVDTIAPSCSIQAPATVVVPAMDEDSVAHGVQVTVFGAVDAGADNDVRGEPTTFTFGPQQLTGSDVGAAGDATVTYTAAGNSTALAASFATQDHAGNPCVASTSVGIDLDVDTPGNFVATANTRQSIFLSWVSPAVGGMAATAYEVRYAMTPLTDANFDGIGTTVAALDPSSPGTVDSVEISGLIPGQSYFVAVAALDGGGGRSLAATAGPITPNFAKTALVTPDVVAGDQRFGYAMVAGHLNGDSYPDLVVGAPDEDGFNGAVYVYFGQATGYQANYDFKITGVGQFGNALTVIDWNGDDVDDLVVGAPFAAATNGELRVFLGGVSLATSAPKVHTDADVRVSVDTAPNWFTGSFLGWSLTTAQFGANGESRLVAGSPGGGGFLGGAVFIAPGVGGSNVVLSDDAAGNGNASAHFFEDPRPLYGFLGLQVTNVGAMRAGIAVQDVAISSFCPQQVYVLRGGGVQAPAGQALPIGFGLGRDLRLTSASAQACGPGNTDPYFGFAVGSLGTPDKRYLVVGSFMAGAGDAGQVVIGRGDAVGDMTVASPNFAVATIDGSASSDPTGTKFFGSAIVNNASAMGSPDVDGDGVEDLLIVGGTGSGKASIYVWFGGESLRDQTSSEADFSIMESNFLQWELPTNDTPAKAIWCGNSPNTSLAALCWADSSRRRSTEWDGSLVVLWDEVD